MAHPGGVVIPFIGMIPGGMVPGKKIVIHGMVVPTCNRFSVNLQCGPNVNPRDDIALHMNFRYDQQVPNVVRNSLQMQQWGIEEGHGYLSFARGQNFELHIHVEHDHFKIHFNGAHFTDFRYRVPIQRVTYISIDGEVVLYGIKADGYDIAPHGGPQPGMPPAHAVPLYPTHPAGGHPAHSGAPMYPTHPAGGHPAHSAAIPVAVGTGMVMGAHMDKKAMKKQKKAMKKGMKHNKHGGHGGHHGSPHHAHHGHHGHHGSSSSSSSSSSEEE